MKLIDYISPLLKWWWMIILATILAAGSSYFITRPMPPIYSAQTTLVVGQVINELNPSGTELVISRQLTEIYANLAMQEPIQESIRQKLNLPVLPAYSAAPIPNSPFLEITVTDIDPKRAQLVANELAQQLIQQSPSGISNSGDQEFIASQLTNLQNEIEETNNQITIKNQELADANSAVQIQDIQSELQALGAKLTSLQTSYTNLLANTQSGALNTLSIINQADLPITPVGPNKLLIILAASGAGFILSAGVAYLLEFWDRTIQTEDDVNRIFQVPVIGQIATMKNTSSPAYFFNEFTRSPIADAFRTFRTNIEFMSVDEPLKTLIITSADVGDGKTTIAANLAHCFSQAEKKVLLVDGDMRRPSVHTALDIPDQPGLSNALQNQLLPQDVAFTLNNNDIMVIPAGVLPPNPTELLTSKRMGQLVKKFGEFADVTIIDAPPYLVTDSIVLAPQTDGVVIVLKPGHTREKTAKEMREQLNRSGAKLIGVVFNRVSSTTGIYGKYAAYYSNDPDNSDEKID